MKRLLITLLLVLPLTAIACERDIPSIDITDKHMDECNQMLKNSGLVRVYDTRELQLYDIPVQQKRWDSKDTTPDVYYPIQS